MFIWQKLDLQDETVERIWSLKERATPALNNHKIIKQSYSAAMQCAPTRMVEGISNSDEKPNHAPA